MKKLIDAIKYLTISSVFVFGTIFAAAGITTAFAGMNKVTVGGNAMLPSKNIIQNAVNSKDHTTLVAAVKAAGLVPTLEGKGPFTVFAPTNSAFDKLPDGTVATLLKSENIGTLKGILTYHVVAGRWDRASIWKAVKKGNGKIEVKTVQGGKLWVVANGSSNLMIMDEKGNSANIPTYDVYQSNGVIHVIDTVLMPK